jgi:predicted kinase
MIMNMKRPTLHMLIGLPGTGKSTFIKSLDEEFKTVILSSDDYLERKAVEENSTYNAMFLKYAKDAQMHVNIEAGKAAKGLLNTVWDQTNIGPGSRSRRLRLFENHFKVACVFYAPRDNSDHYNDWMHRLNNRSGKNIPEGVLKSMKEGFVVPTYEEGFDKIEYINTFSKD